MRATPTTNWLSWPILLLGAASADAWVLCIMWTKFGALDLASFIGPGAAVWVALGSVAHIVSRRNIPWRSAIRWAAIGAMIAPPVMGGVLAVARLDGTTPLLSLFTLGAWCTLAVGALAGMLLELREPVTRSRAAPHPTAKSTKNDNVLHTARRRMAHGGAAACRVNGGDRELRLVVTCDEERRVAPSDG